VTRNTLAAPNPRNVKDHGMARQSKFTVALVAAERFWYVQRYCEGSTRMDSVRSSDEQIKVIAREYSAHDQQL